MAGGIPAVVGRLGRGIAQAQPDVTEELGATGVKALRDELAAEAAELAKYVRTGSEKIEWPKHDSEGSKVEPRKVHSALFKFMYGPPVNRVGDVFGRRGYDVRWAERSGAQGLVLPQSLYDEDSFGAVADALNDLGTAQIALAKSMAEDDRMSSTRSGMRHRAPTSRRWSGTFATASYHRQRPQPQNRALQDEPLRSTIDLRHEAT